MKEKGHVSGQRIVIRQSYPVPAQSIEKRIDMGRDEMKENYRRMEFDHPKAATNALFGGYLLLWETGTQPGTVTILTRQLVLCWLPQMTPYGIQHTGVIACYLRKLLAFEFGGGAVEIPDWSVNLLEELHFSVKLVKQAIENKSK